MVAVAQLVESRIVIPVVAGSSPVSHPILFDLATQAVQVNEARLSLSPELLRSP